MVSLYRDPQGEKIFSTTPGVNDTVGRSQVSGGDKVIISALEGRIKELEAALEEKKVNNIFRIVHGVIFILYSIISYLLMPPSLRLTWRRRQKPLLCPRLNEHVVHNIIIIIASYNTDHSL